MKPYYEHAGITIYHGDWRLCSLHQLPAFDLVLTDPPYGINEAAGKNKSRTNLAVAKDYGFLSWDSDPPNDSDIQQMLSLAPLKCIFGGNYFSLPPTRCWLVWDKVNGNNDFADCELAWTNYPMAVRKISYMWNGMLKEKPESRFHPTQKPKQVMKWCISMAIASGATTMRRILDPYMGSGTTLIASKEMGFEAVGCDQEERYCETAAKRLSQEVFTFEQSPAQS